MSGGPARQRGAIGLFGVLTLLLALLFTTLAVDTGRLWFERRKLQAIADIAALEGARALECRVDTGAGAAAQQAAVRNNYMGGDIRVAPNSVQVGTLSTQNGLRQFTVSGNADAVRVVATRSVDASVVLGGLFGQKTLLSAEATARSEQPQVAFTAGSYLLRISTKPEDVGLLNGLLGALLGSSLSLDAISYQGLAKTDVNLAQLVRASGTVGSVDELLKANLSVAEVINLTANAVGPSSAASLGLNGLQAVASHASVRLGDVLDVALPTSDAAGKVGINVFDLIMTTLLVANKHNAVLLNLGIPGIAAVNLAIIQPPQLAVGPAGRSSTGGWCTETKTAQLRLSVELNPAGLGLVDLALNLELAQATAHLATVDIGAGTTTVKIGADPGIASLSLSNTDHTDDATVLGGVLGVSLNLPISAPQAGTLDFNVPTPVQTSLPMQKSTSASLGDSLEHALGNANIEVSVLGSPLLGSLLKPLVKPILAPLLGTIGRAILDPLLKVLGIQIGGVDITVQDIKGGARAQLVI